MTLRYTTASNAHRTVYAAIVQRPTGDDASDTSDPADGATVNFYRWDGARSILEPDALTALQPVRMRLVDISAVTLYDRDYLIVECKDSGSADGEVTKLTYLTYLRRRFRPVYESFHNATQNVLGMPLAERSCVGFYSEYVGRAVRIECAQFTDRGDMRMVLAGTVLAAAPAPIVQAVFRGAEPAELVVLDVQGGVSVWRRIASEMASDGLAAVRFERVQSLRPAHRIRTISLAAYRGARWLAMCAAYEQNATHLGSVDVYR